MKYIPIRNRLYFFYHSNLPSASQTYHDNASEENDNIAVEVADDTDGEDKSGDINLTPTAAKDLLLSPLSTDTLNNIETITHKLLLESKNEELGTVTEITLESAKCYAEKSSPVSSCKSKFHLGQFKVSRPDSNQVEIDRTRSDKRVSYQQLEMNVDVESSKFRIEFRHCKDSELKEIFEVEFGHLYGGKLERLTGEIILDAKKVSKTSKTVISTASKKTGSSSKWSGLTIDILLREAVHTHPLHG